MEIPSMVAPMTVSESPSSQPQSHPSSEPRKRVRRWHHRGFTGCSVCRRRHVRCDETSPACKNCTRLGLECDGTQGRMTFKVYGPSQNGDSPSQPSKQRNKASEQDMKTEEDNRKGIVVSQTTQFQFAQPVSPASLVATTIQRRDDRYFAHFVDQVSTLLLIYDNSINMNPYRTHFPDFAHTSPSLANAMQALGALHLANTSPGPQRNTHFQQAMGKYGEVVKAFRTRYVNPAQQLGLSDFATCLLLCLFEVCVVPSASRQ